MTAPQTINSPSTPTRSALGLSAGSTLRLEIGPLCDAPSKQLAGKLSADDLKHLDKDADALSRLYVRGLLTGTEWSKVGRRLIEKAAKLYVSNGEVCHGAAPLASPNGSASGKDK